MLKILITIIIYLLTPVFQFWWIKRKGIGPTEKWFVWFVVFLLILDFCSVCEEFHSFYKGLIPWDKFAIHSLIDFYPGYFFLITIIFGAFKK